MSENDGGGGSEEDHAQYVLNILNVNKRITNYY